ncbi:MAG: hypothetical protein ACF8R7_10540 [Phycisphaerales bacterium JB039]
MRYAFRAATATCALMAGQAATAQIIESFEGSIAGYVPHAGTDLFEQDPVSARHGPLGGRFGSTAGVFCYNDGVTTEAGRTYRTWVRQHGSGRAYFGVNASGAGAFSVVLATNSQQLMLQDNSGWGFKEYNHTKVAVDTGEWYQLEIEWGASGVMVGRVYNEGGTLLAETPPHESGLTGAGGVAFRGLGSAGVDFDAARIVDRAGCYADCDGSGELDFFDFLCFQNAFALGQASADCDATGVLDFFDFLCFQNEFALGCDGAGLVVTELGTSAPPGLLGGRIVLPFGPDGRPINTDVTDVRTSGCGDLLFNQPLSHRRIGDGWATWSHGYAGDVYFADNDIPVTLGVPPATSRFIAYVEPSPFADIAFEFSAVGASGVRKFTDVIHGDAGAKGYGFADDAYVAGVTVQAADGDTAFAVGEFSIRTECANILNLGAGAPPAELCLKPLTEFGADPRPTFTEVSGVPTPLGGEITFSYPLEHRRIGDGWATWSHGYTGDVYRTVGFNTVRVDMPEGVNRFRMGVEPAPFSDIEFAISVNNGSRTVTEVISGQAGAKGFGFCGDLRNIEIKTIGVKTDFAIGEFAIAK